MSRPCGLLLCSGDVGGDLVGRVLGEQGGPEWDETVYQVLAGVEPASLLRGKPQAGRGTALAVASSGWWLRRLDDLAERLAQASGQSVLALFELSAARASGWHLATPTGATRGAVHADRLRGWGEALRELGAEPPDDAELAPLGNAARVVHGEEASGQHLPAVFLFGGARGELEAAVLDDVRGQALVSGVRWRPGRVVDQGGPPDRLRAVLLSGPVRLPGPARWARATRAVAVRAAQEAVEDDGWICLVPELDGKPAQFAAAVQVHQLAPMSDGTWLGVLHPRCAVSVERLAAGIATVVPVEQKPADPEALAQAVEQLIGLLPSSPNPVRWSESHLRESDDPAASLGWQIDVPAEACQRYLAASDAEQRVRVLVDVLA